MSPICFPSTRSIQWQWGDSSSYKSIWYLNLIDPVRQHLQLFDALGCPLQYNGTNCVLTSLDLSTLIEFSLDGSTRESPPFNISIWRALQLFHHSWWLLHLIDLFRRHFHVVHLHSNLLDIFIPSHTEIIDKHELTA